MKRHTLFLLSFFMSVAFGLNAQTLTVANGTVTNEYVPFYGYYIDEPQHNQVLYPSSMLVAMSGNYIGQIVWHPQTRAGNPWGSTVTIKMATVSATSLTGLLSVDAAQLHTVWTGTVDGNTAEVPITLDSAFYYAGGNLLVDITTGAGSYSAATFYGISQTGGSYMGYGDTYDDGVRDFIPKTTFVYSATGVFCLPPVGLAATRVDGTEAVVAWSGTAGSYGVEYGGQGFTPGTGTTVTTTADTLLITGLSAGESYDVRVWSICGSDESDAVTTTFTTPSASITLPYTTGFEVGDDAGWLFLGSDNPWTIGSAVNTTAGGSRALYISNDGGATNAMDITVASLTYAALPLYFESGEYAIAFDWRNNGTGSFYGMTFNMGMLYAYLAPVATTSLASLAANAQPSEDWIEITPETLGGVTSWQHAAYTVNVPASADYYLLFMYYNTGMGAAAPPAAIDNVEVIPNNCPQPQSLTVGLVNSDSVAIHWSHGGSENMWVVRANGTEWQAVYDTTFLFTGLTPNTLYTFDVAAVCSGDDTSFVSTTQARTACGVISTFPWTEDFNSYAAMAPLPCWLSVGAGFYQIYTYSPTTSLSFRSSGGQGAIAVMPEFANVNTLEITFTAAPEGQSSGSFSIGYVPASALGNTPVDAEFVALQTYTVADWNGSDEFIEKTVSLAAVPDSARVAFRNYPNGNWYWYLDDIDVHLLPNCQRPYDLVLTAADTESISLSWTDTNASVPDFLVEWCHTDSAVWHAVTVSDTFATIGGLLPGTLYNVRVTALCSADDSSMALQGAFRTQCGAITLFPYEENFDVASVADCWTSLDFDGVADDNWQYSTSAYLNRNGSAGAYVSHYNGYANGDNWLVSPAMVLPTDMDNITMAWYSYGVSYAGAMPHLTVKVSTSTATDTADFSTVVYSADLDESGYTRHTANLSAFAGETVYLAFVRSGYDVDDLYLDDLSIYSAAVPAISLAGSVAPTVGLVADYNVHLDDGSPSGLVYTWTSARAAAGTATMTVVDSATVSMLYPTAGADTLRVTATNAFGADTAYLIVNPVVVDFATLPYTTGFEAGQDTAWSFANASPNAWHIGTATAAAGSRSLYISADGGTTNTYVISTSCNSYACKTVGLPQAGTYGLSFDWHAYGEASSVNIYDYLAVYLAPADAAPVGDNSYGTIPTSWVNLSGNLCQSADWGTFSTIFDVASGGAYKLIFRWRNDSSGGTNPPAAIDNITLVAVTCPAPTALTFDAVGTDAATFHWSPAGAETAWEVSVGTLAPVVVSDTHYTATGLTPATHYAVRVRATCAAGDTSMALAGSFATECMPFAVPFLYTFDSTALSSCWDNVSGSPAPAYAWGSGYANQTPNQIFSAAGNTATPADDWLISPQIVIPATDTASLQLVYLVAGTRNSSYSSSLASYEVYVSPTGTDDTAGFTALVVAETIDTNAFVRRAFAMSQYAGQTVRVAFRSRSTYQGRVYLAEVGVRRTDKPLYHITGDAVAFAGQPAVYHAVRDEGETAGINYLWQSAMAAAGQATLSATTADSVTVTYSAAGTDTITLVVSNAFGADTSYAVVTVYDCSTVTTFPWVNHFDNGGDLACWSQSGNGTWTIGVGDNAVATGTQSGTGNLLIRHSSTGNKTIVVSPVLDLTAVSHPALAFWHVERSWGGDIDELRVFGRTAATAPWDTIAVYTTAFATWSADTIPLTTISSTYQIAFEMTDRYGYGVGIDEVTILSHVGCQEPVITGIVSDETTLTVNFSSESDSVEVIVTSGTFDPSASGTVVTGGSYTATGLTHSTLYTVALRALCSENSLSDWTVDTARTTVIDCQTPTDVTVQATTYTSATIGWTTNGTETAWGIRAYNTIDTLTYTATTNPYTITGLTSGTTYNVEVRALCGQNSDIEGEWSAAVQVTADVCAPVTGLAVSEVTASSAKATWQAAAGSIGYTVYYGLHNFNDNEATTAEVTATEYTMTDLDAETDYEVYIVNRCTADGIVSHPTAADRLSFTTESATEGIYDVESGTLTLYPNPASTSVTVTVSGMDGEVTVEIVDLNGRTSGKWKVESGKVELDLSGMAQGAYFVRVTGERQTVVRKLIVR